MKNPTKICGFRIIQVKPQQVFVDFESNTRIERLKQYCFIIVKVLQAATSFKNNCIYYGCFVRAPCAHRDCKRLTTVNINSRYMVTFMISQV